MAELKSSVFSASCVFFCFLSLFISFSFFAKALFLSFSFLISASLLLISSISSRLYCSRKNFGFEKRISKFIGFDSPKISSDNFWYSEKFGGSSVFLVYSSIIDGRVKVISFLLSSLAV